MKKFLIIIFLSLVGWAVQGQELGLHFMKYTQQSNFTNPAIMNDYTVVVGLPALYGNVFHTGASINDVFVDQPDGSTSLDIDNLINQLEKNNYFNLDFHFETINIGVNIGRFQFGLHHAVRNSIELRYPGELARMAWNGNSQYIGQTIEVAPAIDAIMYSEIGLSGSMKVLDNLSVGVRMKFLSGLGSIYTSRESIQIYTDEEYYQLTGTTDYVVNTANGFFDLTIDSLDVDFGTNPFSTADILGGNTGFGIDLGAVYTLNDKITLAASIVDLGSIKWDTNPRNYTSNGSYTFAGIDVRDAVLEGDSADFTAQLDTLAEILEFKETQNAYRTPLPTKLYLSGSYDINEMVNVGLLAYGEFKHGEFKPGFALSANFTLTRFISLGAIYSVRNKRYDNLGLNLGLNLGPIQIYAASDNLISAFRPYDTHGSNGRVGMNLRFGRKGKKKKDKDDVEDILEE